MSTLNQILIKYDKKGYARKFALELFNSLQKDSTRVSPQYEYNIFTTILQNAK